MIKIVLLTILLFSNCAISKEKFKEALNSLLTELSTTQEYIDKETQEWERKFYQSLIDDEDPNIKLLGYSKKMSGFKGLDEKNSLIDVATEINSMLTSKSLSHKSIATIASICSYEKLKKLCDQEAIFEKQQQEMSDNAYIYFKSLDLALADNNQNEVKNLIEEIAQSKYIDIFMYLHEGFRLKFENYVKENPFPDNKLEIEKLWITMYTHTSPEELEEFSYNMENIMIFTMIIGSKLAEPIPSFRNLIGICKNNTEFEKACLKTSDLFINKSKTIISAMVGYAIKIEIFKQLGNTKELKHAETNRENYKNHYECLAKIMDYGSSNISLKGFEFSKVVDPIERVFGEMAFFESLAKLNYDYYTKQGDENIMNPENCRKTVSIESSTFN